MKYAIGIAKNIFIIEISKIHRFNFLSAIMFNIVTTGKSINFQPLHIAPITPHIAEIHALLIKTYYPEAEITVDASCCAGTTPEKHKAALEVMKSCQINVIGEK